MKIMHFKSFLMNIKIIKNIIHTCKLVFIDELVEICKIQKNLIRFTHIILENYVKNKLKNTNCAIKRRKFLYD